MKKLMLLLAAASLVVVGSTFGITSAGATTHKAHAAKTGKRGPRGFRGPKGNTGPQGPAGPVGPAGPQGAPGTSGGGGGGGSTGFVGSATAFSALIPNGGQESITIGAYTLKLQLSGNTCNTSAGPGVQLFQSTTVQSFAALNVLGGGFTGGFPGPSGTGPFVAAAPNTANNLFTAVLVNGNSGVQGNVADFTVSGGNGCATTGYMQGY